MNVANEISDEEFVPFLQSLGVETYKKSFEWMLNEPDFAGVLRWLYDNLDHRNALTAREEYRYSEIEKRGQLLSLEELETAVSNLQQEYEGLCLPGDKESMEDIKMDVSMHNERLGVLEKQELAIKDLLKRNELIKEQLNLEVTRLHSAEQQGKEDVATAAEECLQLAEDVDSIMEGVIDVVGDTLDLYHNCNSDKELSKKFFTFGPFESYRQTQALFRSHFDLYTSKKFGARHKDAVNDEDLRSVLVEARTLEERLADAAFAYIESTAELSGEQAKVALVANYNNVHPSQVTSCLLEAQSEVELLEQEEAILDQQIQDSVKSLVEDRTRLAVETASRSALAVREQVYRDLSHLWECTALALTLDRALYYSLRSELHTARQLLHFAKQLRDYVDAEEHAGRCRIESMNQICQEQEACELKLQSSDILVEAICRLLGIQPTTDPLLLVKAHAEVTNAVKELNEDLEDLLRKKEDGLVEFINSTAPLREYLWSGCTRQPHCRDRTVAALTHRLRHDMANTDRKVLEASSLFTSVKNGDKHNLRKLWQWFLTDPAQLIAAVKGVAGKVY